MPHDKNGNMIVAGDIVTVRAKVTAVHAGDEYCNCSLETVGKMYPGDYCTPLTLNTKQVELDQKATEEANKAAAIQDAEDGGEIVHGGTLDPLSEEEADAKDIESNQVG